MNRIPSALKTENSDDFVMIGSLSQDDSLSPVVSTALETISSTYTKLKTTLTSLRTGSLEKTPEEVQELSRQITAFVQKLLLENTLPITLTSNTLLSQKIERELRLLPSMEASYDDYSDELAILKLTLENINNNPIKEHTLTSSIINLITTMIEANNFPSPHSQELLIDELLLVSLPFLCSLDVHAILESKESNKPNKLSTVLSFSEPALSRGLSALRAVRFDSDTFSAFLTELRVLIGLTKTSYSLDDCKSLIDLFNKRLPDVEAEISDLWGTIEKDPHMPSLLENRLQEIELTESQKLTNSKPKRWGLF